MPHFGREYGIQNFIKEDKDMSVISTNYSNYRTSAANTGKAYGKKTDDAVKKAADTADESSSAASKSNKDSLEITGRNTTSKGIATEYAGKSALGIKNEGMKDVVAHMLGAQANKASGKGGVNIDSILRSYGVEPIKSDGSDDFWGAEKTANRILDFAKSLAGDDYESFKKVKKAFEKGFGECEHIWGGKLPGVCYDTLDRVRKGFDEWEKDYNKQSEAASSAAQ